MAEHTETPKPTQGIFIGYLALGLMALIILVAAVGLIAGATQPPV